MTRVIHTGDTHVGYRQYHSPERRRDFLRAFEGVVEDAVSGHADAVVHAGDLFHDRRPALGDLQGVVSALRDLQAAGVPFLAVVGNHESKRDAQWLDLFEDLGLATRLGEEPHLVGDTAFYGLDFVPRSRRDDLNYEFAPHEAEHAALVAHGLFEPFAHADWDTERLLAEATVDFDVLLLGDNHQQGREEVDGTLLTYCGSTERASAEEREDRGYNIVTFEDGVSLSRRGLSTTREFVFVDVTLQAGEGVERVREAVRQHDPEDAVVIVTVEGEGEPITPAAVEEFAAERGALVARVNDRREVDEEVTTEVSFADPDEAVRERIADLGLSRAALDIDETVRASKVADSNVRETTERRVRERIDEGDLSAFESAGDREPAVAGEGPSEDVGAGSDADQGEDTDGKSDTEETGSGADDPGSGADEPGSEPAEAVSTAAPEAEADTADTESSGDPKTGAEPDGDPEPSGEPGDGQDQASMEEFL